MRRIAMGCSLVAMTALGSMASGGASTAEPDHESDFNLRFVGPKVGNRIAAVAGVPGDPSVYYAGAASGGVWKSVDGGNRWEPIFDKQPAAAIGALAVAPSEPNTVWAGRGEAWVIRDSDVLATGFTSRSLPARPGPTWDHRSPVESAASPFTRRIPTSYLPASCDA